jgi:diacylglycerol kinase family enzyme
MEFSTLKVLFVVNPSAGKAPLDKAILSVHNHSVATGFDFKFFYTRGNNDDEAIRHQVEWYEPDRVVACGGDGTVQLVARNLVHSKIPLGILPMGSANGLAKALDVPTDIDAAIQQVIQSKKLKPIDLVKINGHWCIHLSDIGTNALLVKNFHEAGDKGMIGYAKHLLGAIQQSEIMHYKIVTPEETFEKSGFMLAFANAHKYGTGVQISDGSVSDGKFEISNVQKIDLESAIKAGLTALNVFVDKDMFSDVISCREAEVTIDRKVHWQVDGEYMGETDHLKIEIIPSAIQLLI